MTREEIVAGLRIVGSPFTTLDHLATSAANQIEELTDKVDGLLSDLDSAVEVAYERGATEWTRLNYPAQFARLSKRAARPTND